MNILKIPFFISLALLTGYCYADDSSQKINELIGEWRVTAVQLDNEATTSTGTTINDPHYIGRKVVINRENINGNLDNSVNCSYPNYQLNKTISLDKLLESTSGKRHVAPQNPKAEDYGLKAQNVLPVSIVCKEGKFGPKGEDIGNWVALLERNTLITNWYDNSYLVMKRIQINEKISPSFSCHASLNPTEKAICSNNELASWDNSVNQAYKTLLMQQQKIMPDDKTTLNNIKATQMNWLKKRNECRADTDCIEKTMKDRVDVITQQFM
ncbi:MULTISPECIES: lysozyme inhibitor LprI family protein [Pseudescherichia]|uniref:lysozyme inhibitor LprI family protein n=1 Tax=Pseudescherichia TaxID=2055880 RepID=UPI002899D6CF|nr:lysozyme inhibitor LprI family protein [Pseudescherichia sp.]